MIEQIKKFFADRALYRLTVTELNALSDRDLGDLRISRGDITNLAREAVWGNQPAATTAPTAASPARNRRAFA